LDGNELLDPTPQLFRRAWRAHDLIDKLSGIKCEKRIGWS